MKVRLERHSTRNPGGLRDNVVIGTAQNKPKVGERFDMRAKGRDVAVGVDGARHISTSMVITVNHQPGHTTFDTANSKYRLVYLDS
jgi:hypothetical protein